MLFCHSNANTIDIIKIQQLRYVGSLFNFMYPTSSLNLNIMSLVENENISTRSKNAFSGSEQWTKYSHSLLTRGLQNKNRLPSFPPIPVHFIQSDSSLFGKWQTCPFLLFSLIKINMQVDCMFITGITSKSLVIFTDKMLFLGA